MKLRKRHRWMLAVVGFLSLLLYGIAYYINLMVDWKYFPDADWNVPGIVDLLIVAGASYLFLVGVSGKWRLWFGR